MMPEKLFEGVIGSEVYNLVLRFFNDEKKTQIWFTTPHPMLGMKEPIYMMRVGREEKLLEFVKNFLSENEVKS